MQCLPVRFFLLRPTYLWICLMPIALASRCDLVRLPAWVMSNMMELAKVTMILSWTSTKIIEYLMILSDFEKNGSHFVWRSERKKNESFSTPWRHVLQQLRQHSSMILSYTCPYSMATRGSNRTFKGAPQGQAVFRAEARCGACGDLGLISSEFVCS